MNPADAKLVRRRGPVWSRSEFLFLLTALTVLAGLLIPWPDRWLDALWIVCVCMTVSVLLICLMARNSRQLDGFPALSAASGLLAILLTAGGVKRVVLQRSSGLLVLKVGGLFSVAGAAAPILLILVGVVLAFTVCYSAFRIRRAIEEYLFRVQPFKRAGLETDRTLRVLTEEKVTAMEESICREAGFFASMGGVSRLLNALMICSVLLVGSAMVLVWALDLMAAAGTDDIARDQAVVPLAGTAVLSWAVLGSVVPACAAMLGRKSFAAASDHEPPKVASRKVVVVSPATGKTEEVELLNPDFVTRSGSAAQAAAMEQIAEFEPSSPQSSQPSQSSQPKTSPIRRFPLRSRDAQSYYKALSELILSPQWRKPVVLLASEEPLDLPVTVAVHTAVLTAQKQGVLLIDADARRRAIAQVFQIADDDFDKVHKTKIQGLSVYIPRQADGGDSVLSQIPADAAKDAACQIIYAPGFDLHTLTDRFKSREMLVLYFTEAESTPGPAPADGFACLSLWPITKSLTQ